MIIVRGDVKVAENAFQASTLLEYLRTVGITKFTAGTSMKNTPSVSLLKA